MWDQEIVLSNAMVKLRPLEVADAERLAAVTADDAIWRFMVVRAKTEGELRAYVEDAVRQRQAHVRYTFVVEDNAGRLVGATAFGNYSPVDKRVEIGWTWLSTGQQGSGVNSNVKSLLLEYAFDGLGLERVEFKTDVLNERARAALKKIGAVEEGVLRSHTLMPDGRRRDTIYYSVLRKEWPAVRAIHLDRQGVLSSVKPRFSAAG